MLPRFMPKRVDTSSGEILLRQVQRKDLEALNRLINEPDVNRFVCVESPVSLQSTVDAYKRALKSNKAWVVCIFQGKAVGSIDIRPKTGRESHVSEFGIAFSKKVHGKGIAEATARFCFGWMKKNRIEKIVSEVIGDNARARTFYKRIGFKELCRLKRNAKRGRKYIDTIIIEKFL
ncbi:MAG: GNAT family N-acetyltransferase [Candidatus Micrarchaeota archaeon]